MWRSYGLERPREEEALLLEGDVFSVAEVHLAASPDPLKSGNEPEISAIL